MYINKKKAAMIFALAIGVAAGTLFVNIGVLTGFVEPGYFGNSFLDKLSRQGVDRDKYFAYLFIKRYREIILLTVLFLSIMRAPALYGGILYLGFSTGVFISVSAIEYGFFGVILYLLSIFPQNGAYYASYYMIYMGTYFNSTGLKKKRIFLILIAFMLTLLGIIMESYINLPIINRTARNM